MYHPIARLRKEIREMQRREAEARQKELESSSSADETKGEGGENE